MPRQTDSNQGGESHYLIPFNGSIKTANTAGTLPVRNLHKPAAKVRVSMNLLHQLFRIIRLRGALRLQCGHLVLTYFTDMFAGRQISPVLLRYCLK
jgi:hypothetical protein